MPSGRPTRACVSTRPGYLASCRRPDRWASSRLLANGGLYLFGLGGALRYDNLAATDARGRALPARFALLDGRALIEVDDRGAAYPVRVDPLVQQSGELISSDGTPGGYFGRSVAVDGRRRWTSTCTTPGRWTRRCREPVRVLPKPRELFQLEPAS